MSAMKTDKFPVWRGKLEYVCLGCGARYHGDQLLYACPACGGVLMLEDLKFAELKNRPGSEWRDEFDGRRASFLAPLAGIFRYYELIAPVFDECDIICLGEGATPVVAASDELAAIAGMPFYFKNDGQNPSGSFKDRGMACAFSCLKWLRRIHGWDNILAVCASTGDTSAAAALYASYLGSAVKSVILLPKGKVTPQQLSQPLGSGATVIELPGVFDDCMKVVERLAETYNVALLNSKNSWRILGQESYAFEIAQWSRWDCADLCAFIPIGNAGNITALMAGFLKLRELGIIGQLPRIFGVQSEHADPVFRYYAAPAGERVFRPVQVLPSVAQAAMIGNPVSFPRVRRLAEEYVRLGGPDAFQVVQVGEQEIMDAMLLANRHGHIACTQGGECLAGLIGARNAGAISKNERAVLDSTAHALKFADFQNKYFSDNLQDGYGIHAKREFVNRPLEIFAGRETDGMSRDEFAHIAAEMVAEQLNLEKRQPNP